MAAHETVAVMLDGRKVRTLGVVPTWSPSKLVCTEHGGLLVANAGAATETIAIGAVHAAPRATVLREIVRLELWCCPFPGMLLLSPIEW